MDRLNKTFVTPLDREDILSLAHVMDDVLDFSESSIDRMLLYGIKGPVPYSLEMAQVLVRGSAADSAGRDGPAEFRRSARHSGPVRADQ